MLGGLLLLRHQHAPAGPSPLPPLGKRRRSRKCSGCPYSFSQPTAHTRPHRTIAHARPHTHHRTHL
jgi:hypothetical protein